MPRHDDERELQILLRNIAAVVILVLLALIVVVALVTPYLADRAPDTTLLLGLTASLVGALLALLGVQVALRKKDE
jgi:hypothetical protein